MSPICEMNSDITILPSSTYTDHNLWTGIFICSEIGDDLICFFSSLCEDRNRVQLSETDLCWKHFQLHKCCNIYTQISSWVNISHLVITFIASIIYKWNTAALSVSPLSSICLISQQGRKDQKYLLTTNKDESQSSWLPDVAQLKFFAFIGQSSSYFRRI